MPHPTFVLLAAVLLSMALAMLEDRSPRERLCVAARVFLGCVTAVVGGGWLMHLIHG
jgi:hypothetical protein